MSRPPLSLWPLLWRPLLPAGFLVAILPFLNLPAAAGCVGLTGLWVAVVLARFRWCIKLARCARTFRTVATPWVTLHHTPALRDPVQIRAFHRTVETELHSLARRFGRPLRIPVVVYLFDRTQHVTRVFGPQYGGFALWEANTIVLAADAPWEEFVRHELAHLFAGRWSRLAPPLLQEGLAVWLQGTQYGRRLDDAAREVLGRRAIGLKQLRDPRWFFDLKHINDCYTLADSFTGFLVRRFGWEAYEGLYRQCDGRRFESKFEKCFGLSLEDAHWEWRLELRMGPDCRGKVTGGGPAARRTDW